MSRNRRRIDIITSGQFLQCRPLGAVLLGFALVLVAEPVAGAPGVPDRKPAWKAHSIARAISPFISELKPYFARSAHPPVRRLATLRNASPAGGLLCPLDRQFAKHPRGGYFRRDPTNAWIERMILDALPADAAPLAINGFHG